MKSETIRVDQYKSGTVQFSQLIVSVPNISSFTFCDTVIGYPGLPNARAQLNVGDAVLYETTEDGILEVRAIALHGTSADFMVTQVSPRSGLAGALLTDDPSNLPFSEAEQAHIAESISEAKTKLAESGKYAAEQLALICRKLDEIESASTRLGRKDWLNYVAGSLTGLCISAAFAPDVTRSLFRTVNAAFSWLFVNAPALLQW